MKPARKIVEALLGDEDPKDFLGQHGTDINRDVILARIADAGAKPEQIDGVEVYGMVDSPDYQERREQGDPEVNKWGVSLHTTDPNVWLVDYDDFNHPQEALAAAQELHRFLQEMLPGQTIHFIDEISPA